MSEQEVYELFCEYAHQDKEREDFEAVGEVFDLAKEYGFSVPQIVTLVEKARFKQ